MGRGSDGTRSGFGVARLRFPLLYQEARAEAGVDGVGGQGVKWRSATFPVARTNLASRTPRQPERRDFILLRLDSHGQVGRLGPRVFRRQRVVRPTRQDRNPIL